MQRGLCRRHGVPPSHSIISKTAFPAEPSRSSAITMRGRRTHTHLRCFCNNRLLVLRNLSRANNKPASVLEAPWFGSRFPNLC